MSLLGTYGLSIGDIDIHGIAPEEFSKLACEMVTRLMADGYRFETVEDEMGAPIFKET